ncbi:putative entry exclusion protein TrbK-alt [Roseicella sp. DB1501]|jgi:conjugative transfer region protein TrbK|uniref:putative entry exclusion protein TrbK-alt n=1 Tax=Roseicella sp. DB1501 TaxID=2730925 RepID=UPI001490FEAA|nr:putative entry exclusion protein TrbK-alt [Roseicella sp. DB1501]NOG70807.1 putative entry exclusion protein TrbK-alt [Roseicella sp. DB1501]
MEGKTLARIGAVVFVAIAITATIIELTRKDETPAITTAVLPSTSVNPLRAMLRQCRDMGETAMRDPVCLRVWAENRDRFLGQREPSRRAPSAPTAPAGDPVHEERAPAGDMLVPPEPAQPEAR